MTHSIPKKWKLETHKIIATSQCASLHSFLPPRRHVIRAARNVTEDDQWIPLLLHMQHHPLLWRASSLGYPKSRSSLTLLSKQRNPLLKGPCFSKCSSKGKKDNLGAKHMIKRSNLECLPFGRDATNSILTTSIQTGRVQEIKELSDHLHLPIMHISDQSDIPL
jgi:hypothetical protein